MAWRGWKDVHRGALCRDTARGDGGRVEPPGGGEAIWRSPEHDHEDAPVLDSAGPSAGGFWPGGWLYRGQEGSLPLFLRGPAARGWLLRQSLSGRDGRSLLRWPLGGVRFFRRRAAVNLVRQHPLAVARIVKANGEKNLRRPRSQMFAELQRYYGAFGESMACSAPVINRWSVPCQSQTI